LRYSILVNSTDSYEDCWNPFFFLFCKFWSSYNGKIYLNTETKDFSYPGLNITSIKNNIENPKDKITWSECLLMGLNKIETDIILYLQEDYFINNYVNFNEVNEFVDIMDKENIACIYLSHAGPHGPYLPTQNKKVYQVGKKAVYRISLQAALWKKVILKKYLRRHENSGQFEIFGTKRAQRQKDNICCIDVRNVNNYTGIIPYYPTGIVQGRWNKEAVFNLFNENQIKIDFEKRGFYNSQIVYRGKKITLKKIINRIKSILIGIRSYF
jgi:hypothetical protein